MTHRKESHLTVNGEPLCKTHSHLFADGFGCDYLSRKDAKAAAKKLRSRFHAGVTVTVADGPCPTLAND